MSNTTDFYMPEYDINDLLGSIEDNDDTIDTLDVDCLTEFLSPKKASSRVAHKSPKHRKSKLLLFILYILYFIIILYIFRMSQG